MGFIYLAVNGAQMRIFLKGKLIDFSRSCIVILSVYSSLVINILVVIRFSENAKKALTNDVLKEEVYRALMGMMSNMAPGPN